ncbi:glucose-1-phosphate adenylyltransferase subunit GlgD [Clostridium aestuarii]|uniref:Glucose-1-phosphate adenylyltransferase subunit GlgD n=1 Tax=Clostridium aestuarii TaxID=338193 RepID=A0ABT4D0T5_9CLOT|nr:glucose-1-phosphate adenylyltransferase subunit GlgD [Clostridium aestuarii]MCY6484848.1 glucose-1-phosphate adenylyltransferase subunit GlgD [Clostridium aestuarii]
MNKDYMGIISLNEDDEHIKCLTNNRPLASVPIGGKYRLIDFTLSNMVNAGLTNIGIYTQSESRSLIDHLDSGKAWDLDRKINGLFVFNFNHFTSKTNDIEAIKNNIEYIYRSKQNNVIFASSNMLCNLDYEKAIEFHEKSGADVTVIYKKVSNSNTSFLNCNVLNIGLNNSVVSVGKNIGTKAINNISMDMFIFKRSTLLQILNKCISTGYYNSIKNCIYMNTDKLSIKAYEFKGYLECINSIDTYYKTNMDMLKPKINKELFFGKGHIYTKVMDTAPTKYSSYSNVTNSLIANGCIIEGSIKDSIISRSVKVHKGAQLENCIIFHGCEIKENAKLKNVIIDKNVIVEKNKELKGDCQYPVVIEKHHYSNPLVNEINFADYPSLKSIV